MSLHVFITMATLLLKLRLSKSSFCGICLAIFGLLLVVSDDLIAQRSSAEVADSLAISCFENFEGLSKIGVSTANSFPSLKSGLYSHWRGLGIEVFEINEDSKTDENLERRIQYRVDSANIQYHKDGRKNYLREIDLVLYQSTTGSDFKVLSNDRCERSANHTILRTLAKNDPADFTVEIDRGGNLRIIKPVILATTLGAISYLFFTVRSSE